LQTAPDVDGSYVLEIQEGSPDQHYRALRKLQLADLNAAFDAYRTGSDVRLDTGWRTMYEWQALDVRPRQLVQTTRGGRRWTPPPVLSAVLGLVFLTIALGLLWNAVSAAIAETGAAGVPGQVLVTSCAGTGKSRGFNCSGLFTASRGDVPPTRVSVAGGAYHTPALVPDVHLLNGTAYPSGDSADVVVPSVGGVGGLALAAFFATTALRRRALPAP
jgi:hypothetical protein